MPDPMMTELRELFATWQQRLGLQAWTIQLKLVETLPGAYMEIEMSDHYTQALVRIDRGDTGDTPTRFGEPIDQPRALTIEQRVVHELLHLCLRDVAHAADLVRPEVSESTTRIWDAAYRHAEETCVDNLAQALLAAWPTAPTMQAP